MNVNVYSVYDAAVKAFAPPFYARSAGEAIRSFSQLATDTNSNVSRHPTDFVLFGLGSYDDATGLFASNEPMRLISASEILGKLDAENK
nr:MAG: nonstructural protein [Microvirus sp.]